MDQIGTTLRFLVRMPVVVRKASHERSQAMVLQGQCHCGNLSFRLEANGPLRPRACQCRFCRSHGAVCASDPAGRAIITILDQALVSRYRFAQRTADFLICRSCGVYLGAVLQTPKGCYSTLNLRAAELELPAADPVDYDGESTDARVHRRAAKWTPTELNRVKK